MTCVLVLNSVINRAFRGGNNNTRSTGNNTTRLNPAIRALREKSDWKPSRSATPNTRITNIIFEFSRMQPVSSSSATGAYK